MSTVTIPQAIDLAKQHHQAGRLREAEGIYRQVLTIEPSNPEALHYLGMVAYQTGQMLDAVSLMRRAIAIDPSIARYHTNLGQVLNDMGLENEAVVALRQSLQLKPDSPEAWSNLGNSLRAQLKFDEAIAAYQSALTLSPENMGAHYNLGTLLLLMGNLELGWPHYEYRQPAIELARTQPRVWLSGNPTGKRILLHSEQGSGDAIQFVRYIDILTQLGASVILESRPQLAQLLRDSYPQVQVVESGQPLPEFDAQCMLLSLPKIHGTTLATIPVKAPYLKADPVKSQAWRERLSNVPGMKIGLAWSGQKGFKDNHQRAVALKALAPLGDVPGCSFISLQKGEPSAEPQKRPSNLKLLDYTTELNDFTDTAALIENLDLIISTDTVIPHLAGGLGKPTWVLLSFLPDWRWLLNRSDSPWYPSLRLFRQPKPGDWTAPIGEIVEALASFKSNRE